MIEFSTDILQRWTQAMAYIDPGSGSAIISAIVGIFVGAGLALKTYWYKITGWFSSKDSIEESEDQSRR